jgi:hypothetical protein
MRETVCLVLAFAFIAWAIWLLWNGSQFLFMLPLAGAVACAEGLDDRDGGDCDPCMGV